MPAPPQTPSLATSGVRVARIFGIDIVLHGSWVFSALLLTWFARDAVVDSVLRDPSPAAGWSVAFCFAMAITACILAHELAHSLVARAYGLPVRRITLFVFGGVSLIEREAPTPRSEYAVSVAGPLASVVLASSFAVVMRVLNPGLEGLVGPWSFLAIVNMALAVFNLIPAFPMDGGRVLRSALWAGIRDRARATRWAAGLGRAFGTLMVVFGLGLAVLTMTSADPSDRPADGLWFVLIGSYLFNAAGAAGRSEGAARPNTHDGRPR